MPGSASDVARRLSDGLHSVVVGQERVVYALLVALLAGGHALVEGVPGTAKTLLVRTLALLLGADFRRIQFTPDLMPSDVVGTTVFNPQTSEFSTRKGPIFANLVLADEINRTPPKTQAALLEAMEESRVTIDGVPFPLPPLFMVAATQNPIEYEGTYPLPEAQLDRFMVKASTGYPEAADEMALLERTADGFDARYLEREGVARVADERDVLAARDAVRAVHVAETTRRYIYDVVARTRGTPDVALGASPRAGVQLLLAAQATASIDGRDYATPDDVKDAATIVLPHRLLVRPEAEVEGVSPGDVVRRVLEEIPVPKEVAPAPAPGAAATSA